MLEIRNIAGLVCKTLDLALTPKIIKSGFQKPGIVPFDPDVFDETDFVQAVERNAVEYATEADLDGENQRRIVVGPDVRREEKVSTSEPSTSRASSVSRLSLLDEIGPMQAATPKKPSNRGRKPMQTTVLTSSDSVVVLREKAKQSAERAAKRASVSPQKMSTQKKTPQKKRGRPEKRQVTPPAKPSTKRATPKECSSSEDDEDIDFCLICLALLPKKN